MIHVKPISWYSKTFTAGQVLRYNASEKEFLGVLMSVMNFRDYIETVPLTYILSDSQVILWALHHQSDSLKLARHITKLFELNINLICVHLAGEKNEVADFLLRIYLADSNPKVKNTKLGFNPLMPIAHIFDRFG